MSLAVPTRCPAFEPALHNTRSLGARAYRTNILPLESPLLHFSFHPDHGKIICSLLQCFCPCCHNCQGQCPQLKNSQFNMRKENNLTQREQQTNLLSGAADSLPKLPGDALITGKCAPQAPSLHPLLGGVFGLRVCMNTLFLLLLTALPFSRVATTHCMSYFTASIYLLFSLPLCLLPGSSISSILLPMYPLSLLWIIHCLLALYIGRHM